MNVSIIVAMSPNHAIGFNGHLPWHLPEDLAHFKRLTVGHTIIMGRRTFQSLPNGPLPGRRNIVLSREPHYAAPVVCHNLQEALACCSGEDEVFVIGGAEVYREALPIACKLYITMVDSNPERADTFFPPIDMSGWRETKKEKHNGFSFIELNRK